MRVWIGGLFGVAIALLLTLRAPSPAEGPQKENGPMLKAVIHVNFGDVDRQGHALKNIENMLKETGDQGEFELVAHGAGIGLLVEHESAHADQVRSLAARKVRFVACKNTLKDKAIAEDRLLPGVEVVPSGAVEVLRKQQEGFGYFKP